MKCPSCNQEIKLSVPPGLSTNNNTSCPKCNATLVWQRDWVKGGIIAVVCAALLYLLALLLHETTFTIAFPIAGAIIGLFLGSRKLTKV